MAKKGFGRLMENLKTKISKSLRMKNHYNDNNYKDYEQMEKSESMRVEIRSRKARKLIEDTLKIADSPKIKSFAF